MGCVFFVVEILITKIYKSPSPFCCGEDERKKCCVADVGGDGIVEKDNCWWWYAFSVRKSGNEPPRGWWVGGNIRTFEHVEPPLYRGPNNVWLLDDGGDTTVWVGKDVVGPIGVAICDNG